MQNSEDDFDSEEIDSSAQSGGRRKILMIVIPAVIAIGLAVGLYFALNHKYDGAGSLNYSIVKNMTEENGTNTESVTVFYDLPEVNAHLKNTASAGNTLQLKISLELSAVEDVAMVEKMVSRINDTILAHTAELTVDEVEGSSGLYWLKEDLLYRINLLTAPVKVNNLNFKNLEIRQPNQS